MAEKISQQITEAAVLIRINRTFSAEMSAEALYEVTRGVWVIAKRREQVQFAFAVAGGIVREVYEVHSWHPAGTTPYNTRSQADVNHEGRWEFVGAVAENEIREKYIDTSVVDYFPKGAANPIMYLNIS
jgi:hypothetical protein